MPRKAKSNEETTGISEREDAIESSDGKTQSMQGYFREFFLRNRHLLKIRSNEAAFKQWLDDNPGHDEVPASVKNAVSNVKNQLREKMKIRKLAAKATATATAAPESPARKPTAKPPVEALQTLEEQIDNCLSMAKTVEAEGLEEVIQSLREARNEVIVKQRSPS